MAQILDEGGPSKSVAMGRLYAMAREDGRRALASHRDAVGEDALLDVIHDFLAAKVTAVLVHPKPLAMFVVSIRRAMISWRRRPAAHVESYTTETGDEVQASGGVHGNDAADSSQFVLDGRAALARLSDRDRQIVQAVAAGADRVELAAQFRTSRANIDKIVSRVRQEWQREQKGELS